MWVGRNSDSIIVICPGKIVKELFQKVVAIPTKLSLVKYPLKILRKAKQAKGKVIGHGDSWIWEKWFR